MWPSSNAKTSTPGIHVINDVLSAPYKFSYCRDCVLVFDIIIQNSRLVEKIDRTMDGACHAVFPQLPLKNQYQQPFLEEYSNSSTFIKIFRPQSRYLAVEQAFPISGASYSS